MLGVFGDASRLVRHGFKPGVIYKSLEKLSGFEPGVVPFLWVPLASSPGEGVVDVHGRHYLFAFGNSGCIAHPGIIKKSLDTLERAGMLGYKRVMLDAVRLPSPVDGLFFLTTCFCKHSSELYPGVASLAVRVREALYKAGAEKIIGVLEDLATARAVHVEHVLSILYDKARELGIELVAAVFPYPLSRFVGQEPRVLKKYLGRIHVMLYHNCPGAACLNAELESLARTLSILGLDYNEVVWVLEHVGGLRLGIWEIKSLDKGMGIARVEGLMSVNKSVYGDMFTPIVWLDDATMPRLGRYLGEYRGVDVFVA